MNMYHLFNEVDYNKGRRDNLISVREHPTAPYLIHNYTDAAMYTPGAWDNPAVRHCRGLITDNDGTIIARPWSKFFNHGQAEAGDLDPDEIVEVTDKMDGSLGILYRLPDGTRAVATRGSFTSDQALHATEVLNRDGEEPTVRWPDGFTPLAEIIYPENRIVLDYGDRDELVLLGGVWVNTGVYVGPDEAADLCDWEGRTARAFHYHTLRDALAAPPRPNAEGLCVRYPNDNRIVKIKQADYVALHRIVTGLSERSVWQMMMDEKCGSELLEGIPDELHQWVQDVEDRLNREVTAIESQVIDAFNGIDAENVGRPTFAEYAKQHGPLTPHLFRLYDDKPVRLAILRTLKPKGDTRAKPTTEETA